MDTPAHIIVVDDHQDIRELVARYLRLHSLRVSAAENAAAFRLLQHQDAADLVVLDIMLPGDDGLILAREIRASSSLPIIFLSAMAADSDRIAGLEIGGDDYLIKPFNPRELLARIMAVLRRTKEPLLAMRTRQHDLIRFGRQQLHMSRREVIGEDGVAIPLSTAEFRLLRVLLDHPGEVLRREQLVELTRTRNGELGDRSIDTQISRLRRKIEPDPKNPSLIRTEWGGGYCFCATVVDA